MVQAVRILLISPYYFPNINPRAHRWTSIAEEWAKNGHDIHVICSKRNDFANTSTHNKVTIHRTGYNSLKDVFYNVFKPKKRRGEPKTSTFEVEKGSRLITFLVWFNETFWKKIYFPDDACVWYLPARKKAIQLLNEKKFDALISVSLPFSSHLIGLYCKKKFPEINWLVDIGDPFSLQFNHQLNNHFFYKSLNVSLEKKVFKLADSISVTTEGTKKLYEKYFSTFGNKISVIPPLLKLNYNDIYNFDLGLDLSKTHIGYFGSFFKHIREPDGFLMLLKRIFPEFPELKDQIIVHFFGEISEYFIRKIEKHKNLQNNIILYGLVPREAIPNIVSQMHFLLNISNKSNYQLPSKSVDYLASRRPIINIHSIKKDLFKLFFADYPMILNVNESLSGRSKNELENLKNYLEINKGKVIEVGEMFKLTEPFLVKRISSDYLRLLRKND